MKLILSLALVSASTVATASPWCHEFQLSTSGSRIQMDNETVGHHDRFTAVRFLRKNIYLHLSHPDFTGNEEVRFVLMSETFLDPRNGRGDRKSVTNFIGDAMWDPTTKRYTVRAASNNNYAGDTVITDSYNRTRQLVAVVVNGEWQKRSDGGGSNFIFDANDYANLCANPG